ncbi:uncharacterized protein K452DRAFT_100377 [Aplosporella prunicola CBS 121167]|uniref:Uncharacterized protein n=1 Tax=Aplosporella prunicola CBS 121167 TaxID=1176127 RepID=A0A6A6B0E6_9PEZI|nr:uncharacterized protein K452DRAFT_100377 [Aplosporella prunicola CBS 121167]KAF2137652.1 hypothetical protein K452DRAFT_100377 [Aplosporella prunicola CBS 121167]
MCSEDSCYPPDLAAILCYKAYPTLVSAVTPAELTSESKIEPDLLRSGIRLAASANAHCWMSKIGIVLPTESQSSEASSGPTGFGFGFAIPEYPTRPTIVHSRPLFHLKTNDWMHPSQRCVSSSGGNRWGEGSAQNLNQAAKEHILPSSRN